MSLLFTAVAGLDDEALRLAEVLRAFGYAVDIGRPAPATGPGDPFADLQVGGSDLVLVSGEAVGSLPKGVVAGAVLRRDEPRDVLVSTRPGSATLPTLDPGARVGVAGARRAAFLRAHRPDVEPVPPGNGGGPAHALRSGSVDAAIVDAVDARRMPLAGRVTEALAAQSWVPSPGQGSVLVLCRAGDEVSAAAASVLGDETARVALRAEAAVRATLDAGLDAPLGALALPHGRWVRVWGMAASPDGRRVVRGDLTGSARDPVAAGMGLAQLLLDRGAASVLAEALR